MRDDAFDKEDDLLEEEEEQKPAKVPKKKSNIILALANIGYILIKGLIGLVILALIGFLLYFTTEKTYEIKSEKENVVYHDKDIYDTSSPKANQKEISFPIGEISTALIEPEYSVRFELAIGFNKHENEKHLEILKQKIEEKKSKLKSIIRYILSQKSIKEIDNRDKVDFILKKELLNEINSNLDSLRVDQVYISNFFPLKTPEIQKP